MCRRTPSLAITTAAIVLRTGCLAHTSRAADIATTAPSTATATATTPTSKPLARPLTELFHLDLHDRNLDVAILPPREPGDDEATAATRPSFEFNAVGEEKWQIVAWPRDRRGDGSYAQFAVTCDGRVDDHWSALQLVSMTNDADALTIVGGGRIGRGFVTIIYRQDAHLHDVRFSVQRPRRIRPRPLHEFAAQDLVQLYIEHQVELRNYLLPLLKEVCGTNPLRPRAGDVYRAFPAIPADPVAVEKLRSVLGDLDAESPAARASAAQKLQSLGESGVHAALCLDRSDLTPEQSARLDALIQRDSIWPDPAAAARADPRFLADCLACEDAAVRAGALKSLRTMMHREVAFDVNGSRAARERAVAEILDGLDNLDTAVDPLPDAAPAAGQ
jgi:hypothetical protein